MTRTVLPAALLTAAILFLTQPGAAQNLSKSASGANGAEVFQSRCSICHGDDGAGSAMGQSLHVPDLRSSKVQTQSNAELARFISDGHGAMPAFKEILDHQQILDEVHHVRSLAKSHVAH